MNTRLFSGTGLLVTIGLFVAVNIVANYTLTTSRLDLTANHLYTLSEGTERILEHITEPLRLRYYYSAKAFSGIPQLQNYGVRVREMLEEYAGHSGGMIDLEVIDPDPFSEAEDQAVGAGIRQIPVNATGEMGYLGLVATNTTDDEMVVPFFQPNEEQSLEYDLTKLVYNLANPKKRVIGVVSTLPVLGSPANPLLGVRPHDPWTMLKLLEETYDVRDLGRNVTSIDPDEIDTLLVIHPKNLTEQARYAIDQFVLKGGKAMIFVDPLAEEDPTMPDPEMPMMLPERHSELPELFKAWGLQMLDGKIAGDLDAAIRVSYSGGRGPQQVEYLPWLQLEPKNFDRDDFVTNQLQVVNLGSAGILEPVEGATTALTPLMLTGPNSAELSAEAVMLVRDPAGLLQDFKPGGKPLVVAARIRGPAKTAFSNGRPIEDEKDKRAPADPGFVAESIKPVNLVIVADTDVLADRFWVQIRDFLGVRVPTPVADNADFIVNALDNLGGNDDLISLRSRGESLRPFDRVVALQREAESQFRDKERELEGKLEETENKITELQRASGDAGATLLTPEEKQTIENFRAEQLRIRKQLRAVQHDLQKNIEALGTRLKFINIALIPLLIGVFAIGMALVQMARRRTHRASAG
ncbi:MAG: Gldg family protein [Gammaproteobacteria bacterium]|nr:Gldg family protein [Gammaproteobacteria bacterium]